MKLNYFKGLLHDGGPSTGRFINILVAFIYGAGFLKVIWVIDKPATDINMWVFLFLFGFLVYGTGNSNISKWLSVLGSRFTGTTTTKTDEVKVQKTHTTEVKDTPPPKEE